jgi:hypothetical protein
MFKVGDRVIATAICGLNRKIKIGSVGTIHSINDGSDIKKRKGIFVDFDKYRGVKYSGVVENPLIKLFDPLTDSKGNKDTFRKIDLAEVLSSC